MRHLFIFLLVLFTGLAQAAPGNNPFETQPEFLPVGKAFTFTSERLASGETQLYWQIADGYYLYQQRMKFDGLAQQPALPQGEAHSDEFFGEQQVYRQGLEVKLPADATGQVKLGWQGCADAGLCYPPQSITVDLGGNPAVAATAEAPDQSLASGLQQRSLGWSLLVFFGLGLLLAFAPCSLPMLPILAGLVVGSGASPRRGFALASSYVVCMALVYAALGVMAALAGSNLAALLQTPWILGSFAALFVILALPMFGFFELQLPAFLRDRLDNVTRKQSGGSLVGAGVLGALSGLLVTVGNRFLPKPGTWMNVLKGIFGFLFLATAVLMIRPVIDESLWLGLWGVLALVMAYCGWSLAREYGLAAKVLGAGSLVLGLWGAILVVGAAGGSDDLWQPLKVFGGSPAASAPTAHDAFTTINDPAALQAQLDSAKAQGQWVLLDYYADWCVSCKIMEKQVFGKPEVMAALKDVRLLRLDVTADNAASRELLGRYKVPGPPSFVWIGPEGEERRAQRITGEVDAAAFLQRWTQTRDAR